MSIRDDARGALGSERPADYHQHRLDRFARTAWRTTFFIVAVLALSGLARALGA